MRFTEIEDHLGGWEFLDDETGDAVRLHGARLDNAVEREDVGQVIGSAKDLVECVAKVVCVKLDVAYSAGEDLPSLVNKASDALARHPSAYENRTPLRSILGALVQIPKESARLRNREGSGHGLAHIEAMKAHSQTVVYEAACLWSYWMLGALRDKLAAREQFNEMLDMIEPGGAAFRTGELRQFVFEEMDLEQREPPDQHACGVVVGRRRVSETFMVSIDLLDPFVHRELELPPAFLAGLFEGLLLNSKGFAMSVSAAPEVLITIVSLHGEEMAIDIERVVDLVESAGMDYAWDAFDRANWSSMMESLLVERDDEQFAALRRLAEVVRIGDAKDP